MISKSVKFDRMKEVDTFNKICLGFNCDVDLQAGKYYVDAKSILGIFSLNLEENLTLIVDTEDEKLVEEKFKEFIV